MKDNNKRPAICCLGHVTLDKIITPRSTVYMPGGTTFYFAHAMRRLENPDFRLVASLSDNNMKAVNDLRSLGVDVEVIPSRNTVYFENKYGEDQNHRTQRVLALADPFTVESVRDVQADVFHLGTLLADDFSLDVIKELAAKGKVSVDAQGYLRKVVGEDVIHVDWDWKKEAMQYITTLKANEKEMEVLTGSNDPHEAARILAEWGCKEVLLTLGDKGSLIYADGNFYEIPAFKPKDVVDATGCGDTYMAGYLYSRGKGAFYDEAGRFAAAMCTLKLEGSGPFSGTPEDIREVLTRRQTL